MSALWIIPSIWQPYTDDCVASMHASIDGLEVDNTDRNRGVAASWNVGAEAVLGSDTDWLVLCSAATRFGDAGGLDFMAQLELHDPSTTWAVEGAWGLGWHLIAFSRMTLERVGLFDENCHPAYLEDMDYSWRIRLAAEDHGVAQLWPKVDVDAWVRSFSHATRFTGVTADWDMLAAYMRTKWGELGHLGQGPWRHPFDDPTLPVSFWPTPPDPRAVAHDGWVT